MRQHGPGTGPRRLYMPGFTLVELLIVLAITVVLPGVAVPSFSAAISGNRATAAVLERRGLLVSARAGDNPSG